VREKCRKTDIETEMEAEAVREMQKERHIDRTQTERETVFVIHALHSNSTWRRDDCLCQVFQACSSQMEPHTYGVVESHVERYNAILCMIGCSDLLQIVCACACARVNNGV